MFSFKKLVGIALSVSIIASVVILPDSLIVDAETDSNNLMSESYQTDYSQYISENSDILFGDEIIIPCGDTVLTDSGYAEWSFIAPKAAAYNIRIKYAATDDMGGDIDFGLKINGDYPFDEARLISLKRLYIQNTDEFETDASGNDVKPEVTQSKEYQYAELTDNNGYLSEPFRLILKEGTNIIHIEGERGSFKIAEISFCQVRPAESYEEYKEKCEQAGYKKAFSKPIIIEAEKLYAKNSVTLMPSSDRSSASTSPQSAYEVKINTVGGSSWKTVGDAVVYKVSVEKAGMYNIALRFRQNLKDGIFTCRRLYIDGNVPFSEANALRFYYDDGWQTDFLGDKKAFSVYLAEGEHELRLEAVQGDTAQMVSTVSASLKELNDICRKIVLITGNTLDVNRDYNFKETIPSELDSMKRICREMKETVEFINSQAGTSGSYVSIIDKIVFQLEAMIENPRTIAKHFARFKSNLGSLGEWILTASEQPLEIDTIMLIPEGDEIPEIEDGFFANLSFWIKSFFASYANEYDFVGRGDNTDFLKIWIQTGRDQGEIIRELINRDFSVKYNTSVQLEIVSGTLLESVLSGINPDIVFDNAETVPMDYALRNAVVDFTEFEDFGEFSKSFPSASLIPVTFNKKVYGIPQTMSFHMFFYRTDIFEEYDYTVPKTWTELCDMIPTLQRNVHEIGIPHDLSLYATLLYQSGGKLYSDDLRSTNINSNTAIEKFVEFTEYFTLYDCAVSYNFANRFRSGEMPCAIAPYTEYNQLIAFAPEIRGSWEMVPIPGTIKENGSISNLSSATMTYIMMLKSSKNKEKAWEYIKWFMSDDVQAEFAAQMESVLGSCAKVNSANTSALVDMSWSKKERDALVSQMNNTTAVPQIPGGYYLSRVISFAFNRVYNNSEDAAETLTDYYVELNSELSRKHKEFGLD